MHRDSGYTPYLYRIFQRFARFRILAIYTVVLRRLRTSPLYDSFSSNFFLLLTNINLSFPRPYCRRHCTRRPHHRPSRATHPVIATHPTHQTDIVIMTSRFPPLPTAGFSTQEEAVAYMQNHGQEHGYAITIQRSYPSQQQVYYCCARGSY